MSVMRAVPDAGDVSDYLGDDSPTAWSLIEGRLPVTTLMCISYTRGNGFNEDASQCAVDLWAVIVSACAREVAQEIPGEQRAEIGSTSTWNSGSGQLWLLREILAMNNYRRLAA